MKLKNQSIIYLSIKINPPTPSVDFSFNTYGLFGYYLNIFDVNLIARNKIGVIASAMRTLLGVFRSLIGFLAILTVGNSLEYYKLKLAILKILGFFLGPLEAVGKQVWHYRGYLAHLEGELGNLFYLVFFGDLFDLLDYSDYYA